MRSLPIFSLFDGDVTDTPIRNIQKRPQVGSKYQAYKKVVHICVPMWFKYKDNISDRSSQNWAGHGSNATCYRHYCTCLMYTFFFCNIASWVANWAAQLISFFSLSSGLSTPKFHLARERRTFGAIMQMVCQNYNRKLALWIFLGYLGEIESDSQNVHGLACILLCQGQCFQFPSLNLECFSRYDF